MNGRYRVTVVAVELYDPLLIQRAVARAGGDGARTASTLAIEVPGGFGPAVVAAVSSRAEADRLLGSLTSAGIEAIVVDDGHPLLNKIRRAWMRLEGRDPDAKTTAPEQQVEAPPPDPLAPPGTEPDRVNFKLHRNADRVEVNPIDAAFGELRVHLVRLAGLIVVVLLFALPWYLMLGRVSKTESLKGGGGGEQVFQLSAGSGAQLPKVTLKGGPSDGSGGDPQREAEQMAAAAGNGGGGKGELPRGQGAGRPINPDDLVEEVHGDGSGGGGKGPGGGAGGGDPDAVNDQLKRTALLLTIAGLLGLVAGLVAGWLSFSRGKPGLRVVKSSWFWFAAVALVGGIAIGHFNSRQAALKKVAAKVQHEGSGSGSGEGSGSGSGEGSGSGFGEGSGSDAIDGSGSGTAKPAAAPPKSVASQVAAMQGPPRANLAEMLRSVRAKHDTPAPSKRSEGNAKASAAESGGAGGDAAVSGAPSSGRTAQRSSSNSPAGGASQATTGSAPSAAKGAATAPRGAAGAGSGKGRGEGAGGSAANRAKTAPADAPEAPEAAAAAADPSGESAGGAPGAPAADNRKLSPVESKVAAFDEVPCEQQKSAYKAMLCKLRKEREAAAKAAADKAAAEKAAGGKEGAPSGPGNDKAPGDPAGGGKGKQPAGAGGKQQPPMGRGLVAGVGFSVGFVVGLLFSLFYYRFYRR